MQASHSQLMRGGGVGGVRKYFRKLHNKMATFQTIELWGNLRQNLKVNELTVKVMFEIVY